MLSVGHASALLYSLIHLSGVKSVNRQYETLGELAVPLEALQRFRQLGAKCPRAPGVPLDGGCGVHDGTARNEDRH